MFWSAFVIRKLAEAEKLSDEFEDERFVVRRHPATDPDGYQDHMNAHRIESHYDLEKRESRTVDPLWIASQLVHSFSFIPEIHDDGRPTGDSVTIGTDSRDVEIGWYEITSIAVAPD